MTPAEIAHSVEMLPPGNTEICDHYSCAEVAEYVFIGPEWVFCERHLNEYLSGD